MAMVSLTAEERGYRKVARVTGTICCRPAELPATEARPAFNRESPSPKESANCLIFGPATTGSRLTTVQRESAARR
jgi:hypothetical protein